jgi:hypothetical protein
VAKNGVVLPKLCQFRQKMDYYIGLKKTFFSEYVLAKMPKSELVIITLTPEGSL